MLATYSWGALADRRGERLVVASGLAGAGVTLALSALTSDVTALVATLMLTGMLGASAATGSGRAIMGWFPAGERGTALGIRQMALPLGGAAAAVALPAITEASSVRTAFLVLAAGLFAGATASAVWLRRPALEPAQGSAAGPVPLRDGRLWRLASGSACLLAAQAAITSFLVLYLHDEQGLRPAAAAGFLALMQLAARPSGRSWASGRNRRGRRIPQMRAIALASAALLSASALLASAGAAPAELTIAVLVSAGVVSMSWNGLAFTAAMELAGAARAGSALGLQTTVVAVGTALMPPLFGVVVQLGGWALAYGLLAAAQVTGAIRLSPLVSEEADRASAEAAAAIRARA